MSQRPQPEEEKAENSSEKTGKVVKQRGKKKKAKRELSVRLTNHSIHKKGKKAQKKKQSLAQSLIKKARKSGGVIADDGAQVVVTGAGIGRVDSVCAVHGPGGGYRRGDCAGTTPYREMRLDWAKKKAVVDGKRMTFQECIDKGYMRRDGGVVNQVNDSDSTTFNFF